jgi:hypothetical protein
MWRTTAVDKALVASIDLRAKGLSIDRSQPRSLLQAGNSGSMRMSKRGLLAQLEATDAQRMQTDTRPAVKR